MSARKKANSNNQMIKEYLKLQLVALVIYSAVFFIFSIVSVSTDIKTENIIYVSMCFIGLSSFFTGFVSGMKERKKGIIQGIRGALPMNLIIIIVSLILSDFKADINLLFASVICLIMSAVGGIISVNIRLK